MIFGKAAGFNATLDLSSLDGRNGFRLDGELLAYGAAGHSVSNAGDAVLLVGMNVTTDFV